MEKLKTYCSGADGTRAVLSEVTGFGAGAGGPGAEDEATDAMGNCCRKLASSSSPGFCELVLDYAQGRSAKWSKAGDGKYDSYDEHGRSLSHVGKARHKT